MPQALFYKKLKNDSVACELCHHQCAIKNGETGLCRVRKNKNGRLYSLVYGYPAAMNADPVEKKPLFHFMPGSLAFSIGTFGCNFFCENCQNWDLSQTESLEKKINELNFYDPEEIVEEAIQGECSSLAYTYNEPTVFAEYALEIMEIARECELKNIWVSNGYLGRGCLDAVLPLLDAINIDLKSMDDKFYRKICGARLEPVLENLKIIKQEQIHLEITTLIVPSLSDDPEMIKRLASFIVEELGADTPWHISRFFPAPSWKLKNLQETGDDIIEQAYEIGRDEGLKYIYVGNIPGCQKEDTYCPSCGELAIRRFGYSVERFDHRGRCAHCDRDLSIID